MLEIIFNTDKQILILRGLMNYPTTAMLNGERYWLQSFDQVEATYMKE